MKKKGKRLKLRSGPEKKKGTFNGKERKWKPSLF